MTSEPGLGIFDLFVPLAAVFHPVERVGISLPPLWLLLVGAVVLAAAAFGVARALAPGASAPVPPHHAAEPLTPLRVVGRVIGVALLVLAVAAGRFGSPRELSNIAPALVVGLAWPALLALSALLGPVWALVDPWDGLARLLRAPEGKQEREPDVWPAAAVALLWAWYLAVPLSGLAPRMVGLVLALYTLVTVAGCLAVGRVAWLARAELFGLLSRWLGLLRRGRLRAWSPPAGAAVLLGALGAGLMFVEVRRSALWGPIALAPRALLWTTLGLVAAAGLGALLLGGLERLIARRGGDAGAVVAAAVPFVAAVALAVSLARDRLLVSAQVVLIRASDPFGWGWDLLGTADWPIRTSPLGHTGRELVQYAILLLGVVGAAWISGRRHVSPAPASTG
jgi:hypothetical protein